MSLNQTNNRINFASIANPLQFPDFLEVQLKSFQDFLQLDASIYDHHDYNGNARLQKAIIFETLLTHKFKAYNTRKQI